MNTYHLHADPYTDWRLNHSREFAPDARQTQAMSTVQQCLDEGLFYTKDIRARCLQLLPVTPEDAAILEMSPKVGQSLTHLMFNDGKLIRAVKITAVSDDCRSVTITGKRGALTVGASYTPCQLLRAMRRAA